MQLINVETGTARKVFYSLGLGLAVVVYITTAQSNPVLVVASAILILLGAFPFYLWAAGSSYGLPIWPSFSVYTASISALPVLQRARSLAPYSDDAILAGLALTGGFLIVGTITWATMTSRQPRPPRNVLMLERGSAVKALYLCLASGLVFQINAVAGWISYPGNTMPVVRGVCGGLSYLGIFALAFFSGQKLLRAGQIWLFVLMLFALIVFSISSLMLSGAVPILSLATAGFVLGSKRAPWLLLAIAFPVITVLHAGKYAMRETYYNAEGDQKQLTGLRDLPSFYSEWVSCGLEEIGGLAGFVDVGPKTESAKSSIFERAGNLHMLLLVMDQTPLVVPYLNGLTYEPIPMLLIPRFLAPNKGLTHAGNLMLSLNYGLVDEEGSRSVSIGWSLAAEAFANFGYLGVFALGIVLAALYAGVTRMSSGVPITSLRFIAGLVVLAGVTNENSLGVFITMQFQGVVGVGLAALVLMRRQSNPFALQIEDGQSQFAGGKLQIPDSGQSFSGPSTRAPWMPPKMRRRVAAERQQQLLAAKVAEGADNVTAKASRPRQVAVPIQPYYYRSRKA